MMPVATPPKNAIVFLQRPLCGSAICYVWLRLEPDGRGSGDCGQLLVMSWVFACDVLDAKAVAALRI